MKENRILTYDHGIHKAVAWLAAPYLAADMRPETLLDLVSHDFIGECEASAGKKIPIATALYYLLLEHRKAAPSFYPPHDICLTLANLAITGGRADKLFVLDPKLLPVAMLLTDEVREIALPKDAAYLKARLNHYIRDRFTTLPETSDQDAVVLAGDPRICLEEGKGDFIRKARMAICLTNWDFLGIRTNESYRRYWLEKSGVSGILQLPRLKRQGSAAYPAIMRVNAESYDLIRMARIEKVETAIGTLDQKEVLTLMIDTPKSANSLDVEKNAILASPGSTLIPAVWLKAGHVSNGDDVTRLGKCVQIIRCQLRRVKEADDSEIIFGSQEDGSFIAREAAMAAMQPQCGILLDGCGDIVRLEFKRRDSEFKFLLRQGDIIFAFRGTLESLGKVGFVDRDPSVPSITGTAFYLLRPMAGVNPVWLFWHLKSREIHNAVLAKSSGTTMLNIGVDDLSSLPIRMPQPDELDRILALHAEMVQKTNMISTAMKEIGITMNEMLQVINK